MEDEADEVLMLRVGAGDGDACRMLVDRHLGPLVAFSRRILGSQADAEDVAQEVFLRVWTKAKDWRPTGAKLTTWLHSVALNLCRDRLRRRPTTPLDDLVAEPPDPRPDVTVTLLAGQRARRIEAALQALPERQRTAIVLCHHQGLSNTEAAALLGVGVEALESLLARGRRTLRQQLRPEAEDLLGDET